MRLFHHNRRRIALFFLLLFVLQIGYSPAAFALTSGPSQPELQAFQPAGTTDMVDLFTGDFSYNIPLFELPGPNGGYPFNLSYQSGIGMDQEASWVGLGWNLNPGAINRQMRGLPDEFNGEDKVETFTDMEPSTTIGVGAGVGVELFGWDKTSLNVGLGITQNNYRGFGYSIDASLGFASSSSPQGTVSMGLGISLNSKEGVNLTPSLGLGSISANASYNSREGLTGLGVSIDRLTQRKGTDKVRKDKSVREGKDTWQSAGSVSSANISLASPGFSPQVSMPMNGSNLSAQIKVGGAWWGVFGSPYANGFFNIQWLKNRKKWVPSPAYGYMHYQEATGDESIMDFNREKDGVVTKITPNLAIPSLTYDIYSVTGQGMSAMYRPMRNDVGHVFDPKAVSETLGGSIGADLGPALVHVGGNYKINYAKSESGKWTENNGAADNSTFAKGATNDPFEPWYFKVHGETTFQDEAILNSIGGKDPVRPQLTGSKSLVFSTGLIEKTKGSPQAIPNFKNSFGKRKPRSQSVEPITKEQLMAGNNELISYYKVEHQDVQGNLKKYNRNHIKNHHIAGFTALNPDGLRYVYGIPAYNTNQEEVVFSAKGAAPGDPSKTEVKGGKDNNPKYDYPGTNKFIKSTRTPSYAHSYLLTSIIGPDYVDVTNDGVTEDDLGYWVKFTYKNTSSIDDTYKWRDPFLKAHYQKGWETDPRDDKGSFMFGEKELWYLVQAETKSHIAKFQIEERGDARGAGAKINDINIPNLDVKGAYSMKLTGITLYSRKAYSANSNPIKSVHFEYDSSLCKGVYNAEANTGKLTLKKLWFEYGGTTRGNLNPYIFDYGDLPSNPNYNQYAIDRWGNYKPVLEDNPLFNVDFPYCEQDPTKKNLIDIQAAVWSLKKIKLPSGGELQVDYESDDYGYVQHLPAMQMTSLVDPYSEANVAASKTKFLWKDDNLKVRFKLESPIEGTLDAVQMRREVLKYIDAQRGQLYFKFRVNLRSGNEKFFEYINGYVNINIAGDMILEKDGSGKYVFGSFYVQSEYGHNPFSLRAWQHLRTNQPELSNNGKEMKEATNDKEKLKQINGLANGSVLTQIAQMFKGFNDYCNEKGWGRQIEADKSWIRLHSPDKIKYGGGLRVRQVTLKDAWSQDGEGIYGQIYEYTTQDGDGATISSGVAAYEPITGGEENVHRYAKKFTESIPVRADNVLFFEYPVNESYYPGAQVGYSKVTVSSLASAWRAGKLVKNISLSDGKALFPTKDSGAFGTTGVTVHEFYTAKEFPVIADETERTQIPPYMLSQPIPFLGNLTINHLTASQGYSIITNDMHGKQKKVSNYLQAPDGSVDLSNASSYVAYHYVNKPKIYQQKNVLETSARFVETAEGHLRLATDGDINGSAKKYTLGQESEFFMDMRESRDNNLTGGFTANVDVNFLLFVTIPIPTVWPSGSKGETLLRTSVANKIIFQPGVMESVEAFDGGSTVFTKNLKWDKLTGAVVLTTVNNDYDEPIYSYNIPAYTQYQGMGAAYQNIGLKFSVGNVQVFYGADKLYRFTNNNSKVKELLYPGDEVILYSDDHATQAITKVIYVGIRDDEKLFYSPTTINGSYTGMIVRSGYRNQLSVMAGSVTALQDPSVPGNEVVHHKTITIPNN